jgi:hypothetical protein
MASIPLALPPTGYRVELAGAVEGAGSTPGWPRSLSLIRTSGWIATDY